jgi:hypothetical protein
MKLGDKVTLVDEKGERQTAHVTAVPGTGKSGFKTLDLEYKGGTAANVPHGEDREEGACYWLLPREKDEPPEAPEAEAPAPKAAKKKGKAK